MSSGLFAFWGLVVSARHLDAGHEDGRRADARFRAFSIGGTATFVEG
jgi:hypothetical protein